MEAGDPEARAAEEKDAEEKEGERKGARIGSLAKESNGEEDGEEEVDGGCAPDNDEGGGFLKVERR